MPLEVRDGNSRSYGVSRHGYQLERRERAMVAAHLFVQQARLGLQTDCIQYCRGWACLNVELLTPVNRTSISHEE